LPIGAFCSSIGGCAGLNQTFRSHQMPAEAPECGIKGRPHDRASNAMADGPVATERWRMKPRSPMLIMHSTLDNCPYRRQRNVPHPQTPVLLGNSYQNIHTNYVQSLPKLPLVHHPPLRAQAPHLLLIFEISRDLMNKSSDSFN
jgi:hypothetical protein